MSWRVSRVCAGDVPEDMAGNTALASLPPGWRQLPPQESPVQVGVLGGCRIEESAISGGSLG